MSKKDAKKEKMTKQKKQPVVQKHQRADGSDEYYISKPPQKTLGGKIIIWVLVILMGAASLGSLIIAFVELAK